MGRSLANKVTLVVGAGSPGGIGRACAERLAQEGATVVLTGTRVSSAEANAAEIVRSGGQALGLEADLADEASVARVFETVAARYGRLDFMHLNAADTQIRNLDTDALTVPLEVFDRSIEAAGGVTRIGCEEADRIVAPVIGAAARDEKLFINVIMNRKQLDRRDAEVAEMPDRCA